MRTKSLIAVPLVLSCAHGEQGSSEESRNATTPNDDSTFNENKIPAKSGSASTSDGGLPSTAAPGAGGGAATTDAGSQRITHYATTCVSNAGHGLYASEPGAWGAMRLTPPYYPFTVTDIDYELYEGAGCTVGVLHSWGVWKGPQSKAPKVATGAQTNDTSEPPATTNGGHTFKRHLDSPITLANGEQLYVAVRIPRSGPNSCMAICTGVAAQPYRTYWGYDDARVPDGWNLGTSVGIVEDFHIGMWGQ